MKTPNPSGYYGLQLPESVEAEITALNFRATRHLVFEISEFLTGCSGSAFESVLTISPAAEKEISNLSESNLIALLRWLCEILSSKVNAA